jgi:LysM repeat protein
MTDGTDHIFAGHEDFHHVGHGLQDHGTDFATLADPSDLLGGMSTTDTEVVHGHPAAAESYWFPQKQEDCVPASVTQVLSEVTQQKVPEQTVLDQMTRLGMPLPTSTQGVPFEDAQLLLESFHVPCHLEHNVSMSTLENYLDEGRSVILGVDPDPIWYPGQPDHDERHAVLVTAIDENAVASDGTRGVVTLSDTGNKDGGNEEQVPLHEFQTAWRAYDDTLLVTDEPTVAGHPGPVLMPITVNGPAFDNPPSAGAPPAVPTNPTSTETYTVQPGDTLWDIAERVYGDGSEYPRIAAASGISDPDRIDPGQTLTIPL